MSRYQKGKNLEGKTNLDLLEQETVSDKILNSTAPQLILSLWPVCLVEFGRFGLPGSFLLGVGTGAETCELP